MIIAKHKNNNVTIQIKNKKIKNMFLITYNLVCFAATTMSSRSKKNSFSDLTIEDISGVILLICALAILIAIMFYILKKLRNPPKEAAETKDTILIRFRKMYENGELTKEEFKSIKEILSHDLTGMATTDSLNTKAQKKSKEEEDREEVLRKLLSGDQKN